MGGVAMTAIMEMQVAPRCANTPRPWTDWIGVESVNERTCSIEGCPNKHEARGWCSKHYQRFLVTGDPLTVKKPRTNWTNVAARAEFIKAGFIPMTTEFPGARNGWVSRCSSCGRESSPALQNVIRGHRCRHCAALANRGEGNGWWCGDAVTYGGAHDRVRLHKGSASAHLCIDCGDQAQEWSYSHCGGPNERRGITSKGCQALYSVNPDDYDPRCKPCHRAFDASHKKEGAA